MGFGVLFIGFFLSFFGRFTPFSLITDIIGFSLIVYSLYKMMYLNIPFFISLVTACFILIANIIYFVMYIILKSGINGFTTALLTVKNVLSVIFVIILSLSVCYVAKSLSLIKIQSKCIVNTALALIYLIIEILSILFRAVFSQPSVYLIGLVIYVLYVCLSLVIIFSAYKNICKAGDENMESKESVFKPFGFLNDKLNEAKEKKKGDKK